MRALIYTRVSNDTTGRGRSVDEQRVECEAECADKGWAVIDVLTDNDISASKYSKKARPEWAKAKRLLASGGADVLVTWESSRAQRDLDAYVELRKLCVETGTKWSYNGTTFDLSDGEDAYRTGTDALDAERESSRTSKRTKRGLAGNARAGRPHARLPFGYERIYDQSTKELVEQRPDPEQSPIVVEIIDRVLAGESLRVIVRDLNARGVTTGTGGEWQAMAIRRIALNPAYAALRVHQGKVIGAAAWPAIISDDKHRRAVAILTNPARRTSRQRERAHLLSGVATCGRCGSKMTVRKVRGHVAYVCREQLHVSIAAAPLEAEVLRVLFEKFTQPDGLADITTEAPADVLDARAHLEALRQRLDAAADEYAAGKLSASMLARVDAKLSAEIADAERAAQHRPLPSTIAALAASNDPIALWENSTLEQQVEIVRAVLTISIAPAAHRSGFDADRVKITPNV